MHTQCAETLHKQYTPYTRIYICRQAAERVEHFYRRTTKEVRWGKGDRYRSAGDDGRLLCDSHVVVVVVLRHTTTNIYNTRFMCAIILLLLISVFVGFDQSFFFYFCVCTRFRQCGAFYLWSWPFWLKLLFFFFVFSVSTSERLFSLVHVIFE